MSKHTNDLDNPELGDDFFVRAQQGLNHVPASMREAIRQERARRHRGPQRAPTKVQVTLRLSPDVVTAFRRTGRGWQGRINAVLMKSVKRSKSGVSRAGSAVLDAALSHGPHPRARKASKKR